MNPFSQSWKIGSSCEINIDECAPQPCLNGNCIDGIANFTCECDEGYEGELCDIEINECELYEPCVHGICEGTNIFWINFYIRKN